jgi:hypothetical protein
VYKSAIAEIGDDVSFRLELLDVVNSFSFPGVRELQQTIIDDIAADFQDRPEAWDARARFSAAANSANQLAAFQVAKYSPSKPCSFSHAGIRSHLLVSIAMLLCLCQRECSPLRHASVLVGQQSACDVYEEGLRQAESLKLFDLYATFLWEHLQELVESEVPSNAAMIHENGQKIVALCEQATRSGE